MDELDLLVDAARTGGGWAFGRLWELLAPAVAAYLRGRGVRDADDVTSEVFLAAFRRLDSFDGDGDHFRAWLFTIAHHKGVDAMRRRQSRERLVDPMDGTAADELAGGRVARSAEDEALDRLGGSDARRLLDDFTEDQRAVLLFRVVADLSLAETAMVLDKPVGAVKALQHRALARLRRAMSDEEAVSPDARGTLGRVT